MPLCISKDVHVSNIDLRSVQIGRSSSARPPPRNLIRALYDPVLNWVKFIKFYCGAADVIKIFSNPAKLLI
jgi:hypothetical protein